MLSKLTTPIIERQVLAQDVFLFRFDRAPIEKAYRGFLAGQYLELFLPDGRSAYFSIASSPEQTQFLELHIRKVPESELNLAILAHLQTAPEVCISPAMGDCYIQASQLNPHSHLCFVAGGTGFSQIKSMVEHLLHHQVSNAISIFWGGWHYQELYMNSLGRAWAEQFASVSYYETVTEPIENNKPAPRLLPQVVVDTLQECSDTVFFACGSPGMVFALVDALENAGVQSNQIHSDVFAYASRDS